MIEAGVEPLELLVDGEEHREDWHDLRLQLTREGELFDPPDEALGVAAGNPQAFLAQHGAD